LRSPRCASNRISAGGVPLLNGQLRQAEDDLEVLEAQGTPRDAWERALSTAETLIPGLAAGLKKACMDDILQNLYGTTDRLPKQVLDAARVHPDVVRLDMFRADPRRLDALKDFHTDMELSSSYQRSVATIGRLREVITGK